MRVQEIGVHKTHCCRKHGCKYGDDDCPVVSGEIKQEYPCQDYSELNPCFGEDPELLTNEEIKKIVTEAFEAGKTYQYWTHDGDYTEDDEVFKVNAKTLDDYLKEKGY